jgi:hypothetical protein
VSNRDRDGRKWGPVGRAIVELLREERITDYEFHKTKHAWVTFSVAGRPFTHSFPCSPRSAGAAAKNHVKKLRKMIEGARRAQSTPAQGSSPA